MKRRKSLPFCSKCNNRQLEFTEVREGGQTVRFKTKFSGKIDPVSLTPGGTSETSLRVLCHCHNCNRTWTMLETRAVKELPNWVGDEV